MKTWSSLHLFLFVLLGSTSFAQNLNLDWANGMSGSNVVSISSSVVDATGNIYTAGSFMGSVDFDPGAGSDIRTSNGNNDIFIQKMDVNGNYQWCITMGNTNRDRAKQMAIDPSGNIIVSGVFWHTIDFDPGPGVHNLSGAGFEESFLMKIDPNGNLIDAVRNSTSSSLDESTGMTLDAAGNIYMTGIFRSTADFDPGPGTATISAVSNRDAYVQKLDNSFNYVWAVAFRGTNNEFTSGVVVDNTDNVYVVGRYESTIDLDPGPGLVTHTSVGGYDAFVTKLDPSGNYLWSYTLTSTANETSKIVMDNNGDLLVHGTFGATVDFEPGVGVTNIVPGSSQEGYLQKVDQSGNLIWVGSLASASPTSIMGIDFDASNLMYLTGAFSGTTDFNIGPGMLNETAVGSNDLYILAMDDSGGTQWVEPFGSPGSEQGRVINYYTGDVLYLSSAYDNTVDFDPTSGVVNLTSAGSVDAGTARYVPFSALPVELVVFDAVQNGGVVDLTWATASETGSDHFVVERSRDGLYFETIGKVEAVGESQNWTPYTLTDFSPLPNWNYYRLKQVDLDGTFEYSEARSVYFGFDDSGIKIYPNPVQSELSIMMPGSGLTNIRLFDGLGKVVYQIQTSNDLEVIDVSQFKAGIYYLETDYRNEKTVEKVIVKP